MAATESPGSQLGIPGSRLGLIVEPVSLQVLKSLARSTACTSCDLQVTSQSPTWKRSWQPARSRESHSWGWRGSSLHHGHAGRWWPGEPGGPRAAPRLRSAQRQRHGGREGGDGCRRPEAKLCSAGPIPAPSGCHLRAPSPQQGPPLNLKAHPFSLQAPAFSTPFMDF